MHKLKIRKYNLKIRRNFLIATVIKASNNFPKTNLFILHPWKHTKPDWMWPWATFYSWLFLEQMFAIDNLQSFLLTSYFSPFILIEKYFVEKALEWFLDPWIQFHACILLRIIPAIRNSNDGLILVIGCICKTQPFIKSRNYLLTSPCFQLRVKGCSLTVLSTTQHSIYTSLLRQVWWKVGINNLSSFKNMHKYITENIKTSGERWYYYLMPCWWGLFW